MATTFLGMDLPVVSVTIGPTWANSLNAALEVVDAHDHSSGKGTKVVSAGLNINTDLEFNDNRLVETKSVKFQTQLSSLTGVANSQSVFSYSGDLYYTNSGGTAIQLTSGGAVISAPAAANTFATNAVAGTLVISSGDTFAVLLVDTTAARSITLPLANAVANGRFYVIKDVSGSATANNITVSVAGSDTIDGASSFVADTDFGSWTIIGDASASWYVL